MSSTPRKRSASDMQKEVDLLTTQLEAAKKGLRESATREKLEKLVGALQDSTCIVCSEDLSGCIAEDMSISTYECRCSTQRIVHSKCWARSFLCSCRELQEFSGNAKNSEAMQHVVKNLSGIVDSGFDAGFLLDEVKSEVRAFLLKIQEKCGDLPEGVDVAEFLGKFDVLIMRAQDNMSSVTDDASNLKDTLYKLGYRRSDSDVAEEEEDDEEEGEDERGILPEVSASPASPENISP